jgi:hypothetical protein
MEQENPQKQAADKKKNKQEKAKKSQPPLPFCTTAQSAEHARAHEEDEPCDDARSGVVESTEEQKKATTERKTKAD